MLTKDLELFCDSLLDAVMDAADINEGDPRVDKLRLVLEGRLETREAEILADYKRALKKGIAGYIESF